MYFKRSLYEFKIEKLNQDKLFLTVDFTDLGILIKMKWFLFFTILLKNGLKDLQDSLYCSPLSPKGFIHGVFFRVLHNE